MAGKKITIKKRRKVAAKKKSEYEYRMLVSILAYLLIGIIWYFIDEEAKKDNFVKFHVKQGFILLIASVIYSIILGIIIAIRNTIFIFTSGTWLILIIILSLLCYVPIIFCIIGIINATTNKKKRLPIIGKFGNKLEI